MLNIRHVECINVATYDVWCCIIAFRAMSIFRSFTLMTCEMRTYMWYEWHGLVSVELIKHSCVTFNIRPSKDVMLKCSSTNWNSLALSFSFLCFSFVDCFFLSSFWFVCVMLSCTTISYALPSTLQVISLVCLLVAILFVTTLNDYNATARCTTAIVLCANIQTKWEGKASKWLNYLCTMMPFCYIVAMANMWAVRKLLCVWWMSCRSFDPSSLLHHIYFSIEIPLAFFVWHSQLLVRVRCWGPCNSLEGSIRARLGRIRTIYSRPALCVLAYKWPKIVWSLVYIFVQVCMGRELLLIVVYRSSWWTAYLFIYILFLEASSTYDFNQTMWKYFYTFFSHSLSLFTCTNGTIMLFQIYF